MIPAFRSPGTQGRSAYSRLREKICSQELETGEPITEARVSELLGVGRGPAREALLRLEAERLVRSDGPHRSRYVQYLEDFDTETLQAQFEVREVLDGLAARRAALQLNGAQILKLRELQGRFAAAVKARDRRTRGETSCEIIRIIRSDCGTPLVTTALEACGIYPIDSRQETTEAELASNREWSLRRVADMEAVVNAIAAHDGDAAEAAMRTLVRETCRVMSKWLADRASTGKTPRGGGR